MNDATLDEPLDEFFESRGTRSKSGGPSGGYLDQLEYYLPKWIEWMRSRGIHTFSELDETHLIDWCGYLQSQVQEHASCSERGMSAATALNYFDYVHIYLEYCREQELIDTNPARKDAVQAELPDPPDVKSQQSWSPSQRQKLLTYLDNRIADVNPADHEKWIPAKRDQALGYLISYTAVRGAEILSHPRDDRVGRDGVRWETVDLRAGTMTVFHSGRWETVAIDDRSLSPLEQWKTTFDPPSDRWPVFPTLAGATLWRVFREQLSEREYDASQIDELVTQYDHPITALHDHEIPPPALTTAGARTLLKRFSEAANISTGKKDHLTLQGAWRSLAERDVSTVRESASNAAIPNNAPEFLDDDEYPDGPLIEQFKFYLSNHPPEKPYAKDAVVDVFQLLREQNTAKTHELKKVAYEGREEYYTSESTLWQSITKHFDNIPGIENSGFGEWEYSGDDTVQNALRR